MADDIEGLDDFVRDLEKAISPREVHKRFVDRYGSEVIRAVIQSAKMGMGPGDTPYPPYSDSYKKQIDRKQGAKFWLVGLSEKPAHMLDEKNFSWEIDESGDLWLVWTAPDEQTGIYAEVHNNGKPIGKGGPVKKREFMHFDTLKTLTTVVKAYEAAMEELVADFNAG